MTPSGFHGDTGRAMKRLTAPRVGRQQFKPLRPRASSRRTPSGAQALADRFSDRAANLAGNAVFKADSRYVWIHVLERDLYAVGGMRIADETLRSERRADVRHNGRCACASPYHPACATSGQIGVAPR